VPPARPAVALHGGRGRGDNGSAQPRRSGRILRRALDGNAATGLRRVMPVG